MPINFIPNDPLATSSVAMRKQSAQPNRKASEAGLQFAQTFAEGQFDPGSPEFLFWQCREGALSAISVWETLNGPLKKWSTAAADSKKLILVPDGGDDLNAFYDRKHLAFFHHTTGSQTTFSGASTDVVAHECGHAFLDTLRPELFGSSVTEHGAFHEAFGDCMAILVALSDKETRLALLAASPDLGKPNFVEATAEDLSDAVKRALGANHPAAAPRRALNDFKFQLPTTLPTSGPPPKLTSEIHSFGRVFSGCFYDVIRNIYANSATKDEANLLAVAKTAGKLLAAGAKSATLGARFFQAVGRAMSLADQTMNGGVNHMAIDEAFKRHNVLLGSMSALMARASLSGPAPKVGAKTQSAALPAATLRDLRERIGASQGSRLSLNPISVGSERMVEAVHQREVPLSKLAKELKGVVALASEAVVVGSAGKAAAMFSALPDPVSTTDEVTKFVETLLANGRISFERPKPPARKRAGFAAVATPLEVERVQGNLPTHRIETKGGKKVLTRIRFLCGCHQPEN